jgi:AraC-like DNA-binding protein
LAKIAAAADPLRTRETMPIETQVPESRALAQGDGWRVCEVICHAGPGDRPFEEQHEELCVAVVLGGTFQYRSRAGRELMTPGALLLGNAGEPFECGHEHGVGDRCLSFVYDRDRFEAFAEEAGLPVRGPAFSASRIPPIREVASLVAAAAAAFDGRGAGQAERWQELALEFAGFALGAAGRQPSRAGSSSANEAGVTRVVRAIDAEPAARHDLSRLAAEARLTPYHFIRVFRQLTGVTPHQYVMRARLRQAAVRLRREPARVLDVALDSGFDDLSNFNRAFRAEFGHTPRQMRSRRLSAS